MACFTEKEIHELADRFSVSGDAMVDHTHQIDTLVCFARQIEERYMVVLRELVPLVEDCDGNIPYEIYGVLEKAKELLK